MAVIETLWVGMLTGEGEDAGTDSAVVLIVNERGGEPDVLHYTFPDTAQNDQERGQANLYEIREEDFKQQGGRVFDPQELNASSIRIGIRGDDLWQPDTIFVWGEQRDGLIVPLALSIGLHSRGGSPGPLAGVGLSTNPGEGRISFSPGRVRLGSEFLPIRRLLMLITTADKDDAGTDDRIELQITTIDGRLVVNHLFRDTEQDDLERAQANLYFVPVDISFRREELNDDSVRLTIKGKDAWLPDRLFLFGLSEDVDRPVEFVVPLVHLPDWPFWLSTDLNEGKPSVTLPLVPGVLVPPVINDQTNNNTGGSKE